MPYEKRTTKSINSHKITVALSDKTDLVPIVFVKSNSGMTTILPWDGMKFNDTVDIVTLTTDYLIEKFGIPEPQVINIDADGSELNIFNEAHNLLNRSHLHTIIFEVRNDFLVIPSKLKALLTDSGFTFSILTRKENSTHNLSNFLASR